MKTAKLLLHQSKKIAVYFLYAFFYCFLLVNVSIVPDSVGKIRQLFGYSILYGSTFSFFYTSFYTFNNTPNVVFHVLSDRVMYNKKNLIH